MRREILGPRGVHSPGTFIIRINNEFDYRFPDVRSVVSWSKNKLPTDLWGGFSIKNSVQFLDEEVEKKPRYPIEILLPYKFSNEQNMDEIIEKALKELSE